jgi:hypothetical protein
MPVTAEESIMPVGYNGVIRNGNRIFQKTIPVLSTGNGLFLTIPVPVETEPKFQILILVPAKPEPEIYFCRNSGRKMPEFDCEFCPEEPKTIFKMLQIWKTTSMEDDLTGRWP